MWRKESESTQAVCVCAIALLRRPFRAFRAGLQDCGIQIMFSTFFFSQLVAKSLKSVPLVGCVYYVNCEGD